MNRTAISGFKGLCVPGLFLSAFGCLKVHAAALGCDAFLVCLPTVVGSNASCTLRTLHLSLGVRPNKAVIFHVCVHCSDHKCPVPKGAPYG